jgi:hypothetical protein
MVDTGGGNPKMEVQEQEEQEDASPTNSNGGAGGPGLVRINYLQIQYLIQEFMWWRWRSMVTCGSVGDLEDQEVVELW